jgi:isopenicillin N synthase-like dioxygenase
MVSKSPNLPVSVTHNTELFDRFISFDHYVTMILLSCFSDALDLNEAHRFEHSHHDGHPANNTLGLLPYPKNADVSHVGHNKHTDIGSLTLLLTHQWGLQVLTPEKKDWAFVQPRVNHAVINVGEDRYSLAYFLRPESDVKFEDADGQKVTAAKWHDEKYVMFAETHAKQEMSKMLTGGMEQILVK